MTRIIYQRQWDRFNAALLSLTNRTDEHISLPHSNHRLWILEGGGAPCPLELVYCWFSWTFSLPLWKDQRCPLFQILSSNFLRSEEVRAASSWSEILQYIRNTITNAPILSDVYIHKYCKMIHKECCNNHNSFPLILWCKCILKK